jgi:hypothetical protein
MYLIVHINVGTSVVTKMDTENLHVALQVSDVLQGQRLVSCGNAEVLVAHVRCAVRGQLQGRLDPDTVVSDNLVIASESGHILLTAYNRSRNYAVAAHDGTGWVVWPNFDSIRSLVLELKSDERVSATAG